MPNPDRTALLIRCSVEEAERIRAAARAERRTVSGFVLNCVQNKIHIHRAMQERFGMPRANRPGRLRDL